MEMKWIDWAFPEGLWVLSGWCVGIALISWGIRRKRLRLTFWLDEDKREGWWRKARWRLWLFGLATFLLSLAVARPRIYGGRQKIPVKGTNIVFCLDISQSMLCDDIKPSRLEFAFMLLYALLRALPPSDKVGLVVFGGSAFPLCPLTSDRDILRLQLSALDPTVMAYNPTTYLAAGLRESRRLILRRTKEGRKRERGGVIVLLSDGEDQGSEWEKAAADCTKAGIPVFAIAIGTEKGALVPEVPLRGGDAKEWTPRTYKRDAEGRLVVSKLNLSLLRRLAGATGGKVYLAGDGKKEVVALLKDLKEYRQNVWMREEVRWWELFPVLVALSVILLIVEGFLQRPLGH